METPLVLMIDDNPNDLDLGELAFMENEVPVRFLGLRDAEDAIDRLRALGADPAAVLPKLILLDLNLPRILGVDVLAYLKSVPRLARIPVVILTTSNSDLDRTRCLTLGASEYQVKPYRLESYLALFETFRRYFDEPGPQHPAEPTPDPDGGAPRGGGARTIPGSDAPRAHLTCSARHPGIAA